jgi:hypothetical protein
MKKTLQQKKKSKPIPTGPTPMFTASTEILELAKEVCSEQPSIAKDKSMPKKEKKVVVEGKVKKQRKSLSNEHGLRLMREWDSKTVQEWADELGVSYQTISKTVRIIRKKDASLCPPKKAKRRTIEDKVDAWIALFKKGEGKK